MKYAEFVKAGEMKIIDKPLPKIEKDDDVLVFAAQICGHTVD